ncbi:helix-turn-helix transcriptional regulator [Flammeovirga pacifica]|uniref:HTH araC/xylS-type domain-containing protein n=1 Tax=Flammeovirga pacifica TaxID=915059 RepID=A0A1S1Z4S3_FLAPC|nr:response regulator transcription factor [Flammeovirga pacifica]OHX68286.1 hypothetical protein NH26_19005 [Flammeovirga pacifica]
MNSKDTKILYFDSTSFDVTYQKLKDDLGGELFNRHYILNDDKYGEIYLEYFDINAPFKMSVNRCKLKQDFFVKDDNYAEQQQLFFLFLRKNSSLSINDYENDDGEVNLGEHGVQYNIMMRHNKRHLLTTLEKNIEVDWIGMRMDFKEIGPLVNLNEKDTNEFIDYLVNRNYYEGSTTELEGLIEDIFQAQKLTIGRNAIIMGLGMQLMGMLLKKMIEHKKKTSDKVIADDLLEQYFEIKDYILSDYHSIPTTRDISQKFGIGETKLKEDFKSIFDQSIFSFITSHRMMDAHRLLRMTDYKIGDIGKQVGYNHLSKFTGAFKKYYGYTPSELRGSKRIKSF